MNKLKTIAVLTMSMAALSTAFAAEQAVTESAQAAPVVQPQAGNVELDRIVAVVNNDVITDRELQERTHVVAINLRRQNIQLPPMEQLRAQVLERLIFERAIKQRARETGIRIDDQMVNASIEQIARQNNLSVDQLRQRLMADGVSFSSFREEIRDEITTQRLREREVDAKIQIPESEIDAYLAEQAGFTTGNTTEFHIQHILIPIDHPDNTEKLKKHAEEIAERARAGEDFAMLAATYSRASDALQGGDIGWRNLQSLPNVMADVLKESPRKGVYIIKGKDSWDVMRVSDTRDGVQFKLAGGPVEQTHARHILMLVSDITRGTDGIREVVLPLEGQELRIAIVNGLANARELLRRIDAGESDFATMARLHSVDNSATRGGDLGWLQPGDTVPEFEKAMNSLKPNEVSEPIKSQFGYHLIQVIERRMEKNGNPQRMRIAARQQLREKKLGEAVYNWQRELRDRAYVEIRDSHY